MKTNPLFDRLRETTWRRKLTPAEEEQLQGFLAAHPEWQAEWVAEENLNEGLARLSPAPVPSNFTARVLDAVEREKARATSPRRAGWLSVPWRLRWFRTATVAVLVVGGLFVAQQHNVQEERKARAESLIRVSELPAMANLDILVNFDAIQALGQTASADQELIRLLE